MQKFSYHSHTDFSDGKNTVEEMLEQAVKTGYTEIGISDHLVVNEYLAGSEVFHGNEVYRKHKMYRESFVGLKKQLQDRIAYIREVSKSFPIRVLVGFETDYFTYDGWEEKFRELIEGLDIDYLHSGNHFCFDKEKNKLVNVADVASYSEDESVRKSLILNHFDSMEKAVRTGLFSFVAHITYISLTGIVDLENYREQYTNVLKAMKENNVAIELNTKAANGRFHPDNEILLMARDLDIPVIINDDCHDINKMAINFEKAESVLEELNYKNRWKMK